MQQQDNQIRFQVLLMFGHYQNVSTIVSSFGNFGNSWKNKTQPECITPATIYIWYVWQITDNNRLMTVTRTDMKRSRLKQAYRHGDWHVTPRQREDIFRQPKEDKRIPTAIIAPLRHSISIQTKKWETDREGCRGREERSEGGKV